MNGACPHPFGIRVRAFILFLNSRCMTVLHRSGIGDGREVESRSKFLRDLFG
jgi:hypothetical protein